MQLEIGTILEGKVTGITAFGAFVELPEGKTGMVHISEVAPTFVKEIRDFITEKQVVKVKILSISNEGKISLSIKKAMEENLHTTSKLKKAVSTESQTRLGHYEWQPPKKQESTSFEDMLLKFKQSSEKKMSILKKNNMDTKHHRSSRHGGGAGNSK